MPVVCDLQAETVDASSSDEEAELASAALEPSATPLRRSTSDSALVRLPAKCHPQSPQKCLAKSPSGQLRPNRSCSRLGAASPDFSSVNTAQQRVNAFLHARRRGNRERRRAEAMEHVSKLVKGTELAKSGEDGSRFPSRSNVLVASGCQLVKSGAKNKPSPSASLTPIARCSQQQRRRIAVVGAGPVGLWAATLLLKQHVRRGRRAAASGTDRGLGVPEIVIFEQRAPDQHGLRNRRIFLDEQAVALLQKHARRASWTSSAVLSEIEAVLLAQWKRLAGKDSIRFGSEIARPADAFNHGDWDMVLWAGGRRSLSDSDRSALGCEVRVGETEDVLVFEMRGFSHVHGNRDNAATLKDIEQLAAADLMPSGEQLGFSRVVFRCAPDSKKANSKAPPVAWVWLLGVAPELLAARAALDPSARRQQDDQKLSSLSEALEMQLTQLGLIHCSSTSTGEGSTSESDAQVPGWIQRMRIAMVTLQERLCCPKEVSMRWVDASYWSSDRVVCPLPCPFGGSRPLVLVGDAAMGKPFHLGTTLDIHLAEVKALSKHPLLAWGSGDLELTSEGIISVFRSVEDRYRDLITRTPAFHR